MREEYKQLYINAAKKHNFSVSVPIVEYIIAVNKMGPLNEEDSKNLQEALSLIEARENIISLTMKTFGAEQTIWRWLGTEPGDKDGRRYLLVNGLIPFNRENAVGLDQFYIDAEHLPERVQTQILNATKDSDGEMDFEDEEKELKATSPTLEGAWIKGGKVIDFKTYTDRRTEVRTHYIFRLRKHIELE